MAIPLSSASSQSTIFCGLFFSLLLFAAILVFVFFSLFFRQSILYNLHNLFDCLYFFAMCINFLFFPFFKTLNTQFFCILSESLVRNRFEGLILLYVLKITYLVIDKRL